MNRLAFLAALLIFVSSAFSHPVTVERYAYRHAQEWNDGAICRYAVSRLAEMAEADDIPYRLPVFKSDRGLYHVMFAMRCNNKWYMIDSVKRLENGKWIYKPKVREFIDLDPKVWTQFSERPLISFWGYATAEMETSWRLEPKIEMHDALLKAYEYRIEASKGVLEKGYKLLDLWQKIVAQLKAQYSEGLSSNGKIAN